MTKKILLGCLVLAAAACGPGPESTRCGLTMQPGSNGWLDLSMVQEAEDRILSFVDQIQDDRLNSADKACKLLDGGIVYSLYEENWIDRWGRSVSGLTYCPQHIIEVGRGDIWQHTALAHELIHWMQRCEPTPGTRDPFDDKGHQNWYADGIYKTLEQINAPVKKANP